MEERSLPGFTLRGLDTPERARVREEEDTCGKCGGKKVQVMSDNLDSMEQVWKCPNCEMRPSGLF